MLDVAFDLTAVKPHSGGVRTYVENLIGHLPDDIRAVCITRKNDQEPWPNAKRVAPSARIVRLAWQRQGLVRAITRSDEAPQVLHNVHYMMPTHVGNMRQAVTIHDVAWLRRSELQTDGPWFPISKRRVFPSAIRSALERADAVICMSERVATRLREEPHVSAKIFVIPHGVDRERFSRDPSECESESAARLRFLGIEAPYILYLGAIEPRKNVPSLVAAFTRIAQKLPEFRLVIAGAAWRGCNLAPIGRAQRELFKQRRIVTPGFVSDEVLPALLRTAAAFVYPSFEEGFGLPVLEALSCGVPTITSSDTVMSDIGENAVTTVNPCDIEEIASAIMATIEGRGPDPNLGQLVASRYTWSKSAAGHAAVYQFLKAGHRPKH
jgi:glycosyltransferase involved in cell wall biosynthesis